mmetsp:Transcript_15355/g.22302  ORF Transcript_15355/g.22302 Transcript_15355/m.22302 type:complete len:514 (+) Transcript_15355:353-1894(+)
MAECEDVFSSEDHCLYAQNNCSWMFSFYFCTLDESPWSWVFLIVLFVLFVYLLGTTADEYFSPSLSDLADKMNLSPSLAGVTLLAFGNGAPDVFSSLLAASKLKIYLSLGGLVGAGLFVTAVVVSSVVYSGGEIQMPTAKLVRDVGFYLLTVLLILTYGAIGEIGIFEASLFPVIYIVYVCLVLYMEKESKGSKEQEEELEMPVLQSNFVEWGSIIDDYLKVEESHCQSITIMESKPHSFSSNLQWSMLKFTYFVEHSQKSFESLSITEQIFFIVLFPLNLFRELTIPYYTEANWSRGKASVVPLFIALFLLTTEELLGSSVGPFPVWVLGLVLSLTSSGFIWCTTKVSKPPSYNWVFSCVAFVMSILWICNICSYVVDLLSLVGLLLKVPIPLLGMTFLAWGNSAGDFWANKAIAKIGLSQTALTACYAGPLFNMLIGLGLALMYSTFSQRVEFSIFQEGVLTIAVLFLLTSILVGLSFGVGLRGRVTNMQGLVLVLVYLCFFVTLTIYIVI